METEPVDENFAGYKAARQGGEGAGLVGEQGVESNLYRINDWL